MATVTAREATPDDLPTLLWLYGGLSEEMTQLSPWWPIADGLAEPIDESMAALVEGDESFVVVGEIDGLPFGFLSGRIEPMLPQAGDGQIGAIRLVFVDHPAREVGVGEAMLELGLDRLRSMGATTLDAHVLPGHRLVKNFFEAAGFKARSIVMTSKGE